MKKQLLFTTILCCLSILSSKANNVSISSISASGTTISFNLSWENSWNSMNNIDTLYPRNWDAVWVFVKVQSNNDNLWQHQLVSTSAATHSVTGGGATLQVDPASDGVGVFIRRSAAGSGNITNAAVTLQLGTLPAGTLNYKVFGIEMVNIPTGAFNIGDGTTNTFELRFYDSTVSANAEMNGYTAGKLYAGSAAVPAAFPVGYDSMYAMKYEITNEQFADFLNTLTYDQQANHIDVAPNSAVGTKIFSGVGAITNYLRIEDTGTNNTIPAKIGCDYDNDAVFNSILDGLTMACPMLTNKNFLAYLDWSGLRPMSEMEFEKICRGSRYNSNPVARVANEYVWGTTDLQNYSSASAGMVDIHQPTMRFTGTPVNGRAFAGGGTISGRAGMFAESATGRASSGAGFYGNMNMGDNVCETVIGINSSGVAYDGSLGDGVLDVNGETNQANWPAAGCGYRGSYYGANSGVNSSTPGHFTRMPKLSNRYYSSTTVTTRPNYLGGRGVR